jgi:large subunit ribosomal protein L6
MSRIGKKAVSIPAGVTVTVDENNFVTVKGPKGEISFGFDKNISIEVKDGGVHVSRPNDEKANRQLHGTTRALINNMVKGVSEGFKIALEIKGTGYRASLSGNTLTVIVGYSNPVLVEVPKGLSIELPTQTDIVVTGYDKQLIGEFCAGIRGIRPPEPYKGKGIRYKGENVRRKEGKTAK